MTRKWLHHSVLAVALSSLLIGSISPATLYAKGTTLRKSAWADKIGSKENIIQVPPLSSSSAPGPQKSPYAASQALPSATGSKDSANKADDEVVYPYATDRIIVKFKDGYNSPETPGILSTSEIAGAVDLAPIGAKVVHLDTPSDDLLLLVNLLSIDSHVEYAEPDFRVYPASTPNDPYFPKQWNLLNTGQTPAYNYNNPNFEGKPGIPGLDIGVSKAWDITQGSSDVLVAVLDTGIQITHPELAGSIWTNPDEIASDGIDNDNDGFVDDVNGWNFAGNNNQLFNELDTDVHGTEVAGIIAASMNNDAGIAGIAPNVRILPIKFIQPGPQYGLVSDLVQSIGYAEDKGAQIANISAEFYNYSQALEDAISASDMLFVAAAGNSNISTDNIPAYPASYENDNILSVTSIENEGHLAYYANTGYKSVDVAAPGEAITTTFPVQGPGFSAEIDNGTYKAVVNGLPFENILDGEDEDQPADRNYRQDAFDKAMDFLGASKNDPNAKILLVQDDFSNMTPIASTSKLSKYRALLEDYAGFDIDEDKIITAPNGGDGPSAAFMENYDVVIWFTGMADRLGISNLTPNDQKNLTDYLNSGKSLLLTGNNVFNGSDERGGNSAASTVDTPFVKDILHLTMLEQGDYLYAEGMPGTIYEGEKYPLDEERSNYNWLVSLDPSVTKIDLRRIPPDFNFTSYDYAQGTSMAAAHATGVAALLLSQDPSLSPLAMKQRIMNSGTALSSLTGKIASGRVINAYNALSDDDIPGTPLPGDGTVNNHLDEFTDHDDVYALELHNGDNLSLSLTGGSGTDFDLYLYSPEATTVTSTDDVVASSENAGTSKESLSFKVTKSGTYYIDVAVFKGSGNYALTVKTEDHSGLIEDSSSSIVYEGSWSKLGGSDYTAQSAKQLSSAGSAELSFVGNYISWIAAKNSQQGIADVYLDGKKIASPSLYSQTALTQQIVYETAVPYGKHRIKIVWAGKADPAAANGGKAINVDAFQTGYYLQDSDYSTLYSGSWMTSYSPKLHGGQAKYTNTKGSIVEFQFEGAQVKLLGFTGPDRGTAQIYIDGKPASDTPVDMYSAKPAARAVVFESGTLSSGKHTLSVVTTGEKNAKSSGTYIWVDALSIAQ